MPKNDHGRSSDMKKRDSLKGEDDDWRGTALSRIGKLIKQADPEVVEERKWRKPTNPEGVPVWSHGGMICTGETYKNHVKITFARGASLKDPSHLFNASLEGNARRAIDIHDGKKIDEEAFKALIRAAVALNEVVGPPQMNRSRILPGSLDWSGLASVDGLTEERGPVSSMEPGPGLRQEPSRQKPSQRLGRSQSPGAPPYARRPRPTLLQVFVAPAREGPW